MNTHKKILLHLSLIDGIGPGIIQKIVASKPKHIAWSDLSYFSVSDWVLLAIPIRIAEKIVVGLQTDYLAQEQALVEKYQMNWTTILDPEYPDLLKHIHLPPSILYWQGTLPKDGTKTIAVVGARKADEYGKRAIERLIPPLVHHGITVVSGGALGADSMAHRVTLDAGGTTIAVLGSGLLQPYPRENIRLFDRIIEQAGAVVSSFPVRTAPCPGNFPARNRIIAGLSSGVIVVQASRKSGARITAQFALEQGRDVFSVPGPIDNELSEGCHALIQEGAKLVAEPLDILQEWAIEERDDGKKHEAGDQYGALSQTDDPIKIALMKACMHPQSVDNLALQLNCSVLDIQRHLFDLQIAGLIEQDFTGLWCVV